MNHWEGTHTSSHRNSGSTDDRGMSSMLLTTSAVCEARAPLS